MSPDCIDQLVAMLKQQEGLRLHMYTDSTHNSTIGYGHNLSEKAISFAAAKQILLDDINDTMRDLADQASWYTQMSDARQNAIISMAFNLGIAGLLQWDETLKAMMAGKWQTVHDHLLASKAATEDPQRYQQLAEIFLTGRMPNVG